MPPATSAPGGPRGGSGTATSTCSITCVGAEAVAERVVGEHQPVAQDVGRQVAHVVARRRARGRAAARAPAPPAARPIGPRGLAPYSIWRFELVRVRTWPGGGWRRRVRPRSRSPRGRRAPTVRLGVALEVDQRHALADLGGARRGCVRPPPPPRRPSGSRRGSSSGSGRPGPRAAGRCPRTRSGSAWRCTRNGRGTG